MAGPVSKKTWIRVTPGTVADSGNITSVGNAMIQGTATNVPIRGWIRRARAEIAGSATDLAFLISESASSSTFGTVLEYGSASTLTSDPLDAEEDPGIFYKISPSATGARTGTIYIAARVNSGSETVDVQLDIEPAI